MKFEPMIIFNYLPPMETVDKNSLRYKLKSHYELLKKFFPYLWPKGKYNIQFRVVVSILFLFLSKGIGIVRRIY